MNSSERLSGRKKSINIVLLGHVDSGKSTFGGHLMYKLGEVSDRCMETFERETENIGHGSFKYSWVLSKNLTERERGISIDVSYGKFQTEKFDVTVIDVGGHRDFMKNMLSGTSQADVGILVLDSARGAFEAGLTKTYGMTNNHLIISYVFGLKQIIVVVNKIDGLGDTTSYNERRFDEISTEIQRMIKKVGYRIKKIPIIPISGWTGENLINPSPNLHWWKKGKTKWGGMTFIQALDSLKTPRRRINFPLRVPISHTVPSRYVRSVNNQQKVRVIVGKVETGVLQVGQMIRIEPLGKIAKVLSLEKQQKPIKKAIPGDIVGIGITRVDHQRGERIRRGFVCGSPHFDPPLICERMEVQMNNLDHPGKIKVGYSPIVDFHTTHVRSTFEELVQKLDMKTGKVIENQPKELVKGESAVVIIKPLVTRRGELVVEPHSLFSNLGRFVIRDMKTIVAIGVIKKVFKRGKGWVSTFNISNSMEEKDERERVEYIADSDVINDFSFCSFELKCGHESNIFVWKSLLL